ncbi:MAG: colanic acid biosynthesis glycosyltransferase WcaL, partial [Pseudomonadota bacterium]
MSERIGYLAPDFPSQTHAFFWREAQALAEAGVAPKFFSTRRPPDAACPHAFGPEARAGTTYLFPPPTPAIARLAARPLRAINAIRYVLGLRETPLAGRLKLMALIPCAMALATSCRAAGVRHVHIHSFANSAHIGALASILDGLDYSLVLHGDLPVYGADHADKMKRARLVAAVTEPLSRQIRAVAPDRPEWDVPVIWMGVDTEAFRPPETPRADPVGRPFEALSV